MRILEYENLGLFIGFSNSGYYITSNKDEAAEFGTPQNDPDLKNTRRRIDKQLFGKVDFYRKGHLVVREQNESRINGPETFKAIAEALPYEIQSTLLAIRDDGITTAQVPDKIYIAMHELLLIETDGETGANLRLSKLGKHLVDYCTC